MQEIAGGGGVGVGYGGGGGPAGGTSLLLQPGTFQLQFGALPQGVLANGCFELSLLLNGADTVDWPLCSGAAFSAGQVFQVSSPNTTLQVMVGAGDQINGAGYVVALGCPSSTPPCVLPPGTWPLAPVLILTQLQ